MSKSVDQTVLDYFSLLLSEESKEGSDDLVSQNHNVPLASDAETVHLPKRKAKLASLSPEKEYKLEQVEEPQLNKQALEELLAPVFTAEQVEAAVDVQAEIDAKVKAKQVVESKVETKVVVKKDVEELEKTSAYEDVAPRVESVEPENEVSHKIEAEPQVEQSAPPSITKDLQEQLDEEFQLLFFKVAGLILAVPLVNLGGIVRVEKINQIFGRPSWFHGVQTHRESQLNIVDTCAWVMPEKYDEKLAETVDYQYLVVLEDSNWGLACESLVNTVKVDKSQVNWRSKPGKRPWLAGVVKQQMCGILNVESLIEMLNAGLGCQDPID